MATREEIKYLDSAGFRKSEELEDSDHFLYVKFLLMNVNNCIQIQYSYLT